MKISDILNNGKINISCELFPPKLGSELEQAKTVVAEMAELSPSFMSVTYGAAGGTSETTVKITDEIQNRHAIPALAHLTCVNSDKSKVKCVLDSLKAAGICNVLALRGDIVDGKMPTDFLHASDLIPVIKAAGDFCVGGACYPECHPDSQNLFSDLDGLKAKADSGCEFFTTQMFFDNNIFYKFMYRLLSRGITTPVIAGIMPVTNKKQVDRIVSLSGTVLPARFRAIVDRFGDNPAAMKQAGIAYATEQIIDLAASGVNNIHIYTMNRPDIAGGIMKNLSEILK